MRIDDASNAESLIKTLTESAKASQQIGVAILKKQQEVEQGTAVAVLSLLQSAASLDDLGNFFDARA